MTMDQVLLAAGADSNQLLDHQRMSAYTLAHSIGTDAVWAVFAQQDADAVAAGGDPAGASGQARVAC